MFRGGASHDGTPRRDHHLAAFMGANAHREGGACDLDRLGDDDRATGALHKARMGCAGLSASICLQGVAECSSTWRQNVPAFGIARDISSFLKAISR